MISWHCIICGKDHYSTCPYDLHDISVSNNTYHSLQQDKTNFSRKTPGTPTKIGQARSKHQSTPIRVNKLQTDCKKPL